MHPLYTTRFLQLFILLLGVDAQVQIFDTSVDLEARDFRESGSDISWANLNNVGNGDPGTYASSKLGTTGTLTVSDFLNQSTLENKVDHF